MLYREIIAVFFSQIHTKNTNALCGQNVELLNVKLVVHIVTLGFREVDMALDSEETSWLTGAQVSSAVEAGGLLAPDVDHVKGNVDT